MKNLDPLLHHPFCIPNEYIPEPFDVTWYLAFERTHTY
jgi:hypothetical protein